MRERSEVTWDVASIRPRNEMSLGNLLNNIYSIAHRLKKMTTRNPCAGNVNDIQFLGTQRAK